VNTDAERAVNGLALLEHRRIETLKIRCYDSFPSHYCCVFDKYAILLGTYTYRDWKTWDIDFDEALVIGNNDAAQKLVIIKYTRWFDDVFDISKPWPLDCTTRFET
jgi:hypothetical protein